MSKNDYAIEVHFRPSAGFTPDKVSRFIDRAMASVGFHFYRMRGRFGQRTPKQLADFERHHEEVVHTLCQVEMPTAAYGWPIMYLPWWKEREFLNFDGPAEPDEDCKTMFYSLDNRSIGFFHDLVRTGNRPVMVDWGDGLDDRQAFMDASQYWFFHQEPENNGQAFGRLHLRTAVLQSYGERSALDRFWTLVLRDVVLQFHQGLKSSETTLTKDVDGPPFFILTDPSDPDFWPPDYRYEFLSCGDPKWDAALDAYEQDLRDDPLRTKILSQEI